MSSILSYSPGQQATIVFETLDGYNQRADGYMVPSIARIIFPNLYLAAGYPQNMARIDVGLYAFQFTIPTEASAVGSYIVDILYYDPDTGEPGSTFFQVIVSAPFGQYSISTI
jgi:hypothetical protein